MTKIRRLELQTMPEREHIIFKLLDGYTREEIDSLWDSLYSGLVEHRPEDIVLKARAIVNYLSSPTLVPFPEGIDVPDDHECMYSL
jgi:hypothetical protein